jgi:hypothetical protein
MMKTLKKESINTSGKVEKEYIRVKDEEVKAKLADGFKLCGKVEWKTATKGYGKKAPKSEVKKEVDVTEGLAKKKPYQKPSKS